VQGPGKSWNLLCSDTDGGCNDADANIKVCASAHLLSIEYIWILRPLFTVHLGKRVQLLRMVYASTVRSVARKFSIGLMTGSWKMLLVSWKVVDKSWHSLYPREWEPCRYTWKTAFNTHTCLTAVFLDYPGEPVPER